MGLRDPESTCTSAFSQKRQIFSIANLYKFIHSNRFNSLTMPQAQPELKKVSTNTWRLDRTTDADSVLKYLDKRLFVQLNGSRKVIGVLRGYDVRLASSLASGVQSRHWVKTMGL